MNPIIRSKTPKPIGYQGRFILPLELRPPERQPYVVLREATREEFIAWCRYQGHDEDDPRMQEYRPFYYEVLVD